VSENINSEKQQLVQKFGGTSLADLAGFEASAAVIGRYTDEYQVIVVLSAVKGVTDLLLAATGRRPNTGNLGLEAAGVELDAVGAVKVDSYSRSSRPNIYAVGDVTDRIALTPVAIQEAMAFVDTVYLGRPRPMDHENVPSAVFSQPPVGTVGLTEAEARARYGALDIYRSGFRPMKHTLSGRDEKTMMKLIVERAGQKVVGAHMVGLDAPEIIQGLAIAIKAGATKAAFDATVGIHPTAAEEFVTMRAPVAAPTEAAAE